MAKIPLAGKDPFASPSSKKKKNLKKKSGGSKNKEALQYRLMSQAQQHNGKLTNLIYIEINKIISNPLRELNIKLTQKEFKDLNKEGKVKENCFKILKAVYIKTILEFKKPDGRDPDSTSKAKKALASTMTSLPSEAKRLVKKIMKNLYTKAQTRGITRLRKYDPSKEPQKSGGFDFSDEPQELGGFDFSDEPQDLSKKNLAAKPKKRKVRARYFNKDYVKAVQEIINFFSSLAKEPKAKGELEKLKSVPKLAVDGKYGSRTRSAVKAFQRMVKTKVDGYWGPKTSCAFSKMISKTADSNCKSPSWVVGILKKYKKKSRTSSAKPSRRPDQRAKPRQAGVDQPIPIKAADIKNVKLNESKFSKTNKRK